MAGRSLGILTLDLITRTAGFSEGLSKAERDSDKWKKQVTKDAKKVGESLLAIGTAATAAATAIVLSTAESAAEINKLSNLTGLSTQEFQKYAAGAKALGIEQEKLADIFKDTSDKVGDFLQTGGGALADFFENIAPKVGVTAEQFRNLSGPQALELYVSSLEKANVSQNEMIFFMEAIASDATLLLPLLKNNSEGFKLLGDEALRAGAIMDQDTITAAQELNAALFLIDLNTSGLKNTLATAFIPTITETSLAFLELSASSDSFKGVLTTIDYIVKTAAVSVVGLAGGLELLGKKIAGALATVAAIPSKTVDAVKVYQEYEKDFEETSEKYANAINRIWDAGQGSESNKTIEQIAKIQAATEAATNAGASSLDGKKASALQSNLEKLQESLMSETEATIAYYDENHEILVQALENDLLTKQEFADQETRLKAETEKRLTDIQKKEAQARLKATQGALGNLSTLMNSESRKMFEVGKAAALANAIISGHEAAVSSYAAGARIGGPPLGAAFAATAIAATAVQISAIRSASFGGGSSGGSGASVTESVNAASTPVQPQQAQPERNVFIRGINSDDIFTGAQIVELLNNELVNGGRLVLEN